MPLKIMKGAANAALQYTKLFRALMAAPTGPLATLVSPCGKSKDGVLEFL